MPRPGKGGRYHHGDLRTALIDTAIELIGERGVRGFSLAEASRRLGVAVSAPYAHFADRDDLLAAVAVRAYEQLLAGIRPGQRHGRAGAERTARAILALVASRDVLRRPADAQPRWQLTRAGRKGE
jgi:AcrR family transcriptional regulator